MRSNHRTAENIRDLYLAEDERRHIEGGDRIECRYAGSVDGKRIERKAAFDTDGTRSRTPKRHEMRSGADSAT